MSLATIKIERSAIIGGESVPAVNLRDLHQSVGSNRQFADWAKRRLEETQADEGADYLLHKFVKQLPSGSKHVTDYLVTLDLAKEIAMLERNEKGKAMRQYFIRVEKEFRAGRQQNNAASWLVGKLLEIAPAEDLLRLLSVRHSYGSLAKNGKARTGWRGPAYVASKHRQKDARVFNEAVIRLNVTVQLELPKLAELLNEGGKAA